MKRLIGSFAFSRSDSDQVRLEKKSIFLVAGLCILAGMVWSAMYLIIFGAVITSFLPIVFIVIVGTTLLISHFTKNHQYAIYAQIVCIMYVTALIQWTIGGIFDSGFVLAWAILGPIIALMFFSVRHSIFWFVLYLANLFITVIFDDYFVAHGHEVTEPIKAFFFIMNLSFSSMAVFIFSGYYVNAAIRARHRAQRLIEANLQQEILLRQSEKLATLGKLSAGVAHELNNPSAAVQRGVEQLHESVRKTERNQYRLGQSGLSAAQTEYLRTREENVRQLAKKPLDLDAITRSDQETEIQDWLEEKDIPDAWKLSPQLVNIGFNCKELSELENDFSSEQFPEVISLLCNKYISYNLMEEIGQGTGRILETVKALKSYAYLDQAPVQKIDIHEGLDNTLVMLRSMLKKGIEVSRDYDRSIPKIEAHASELNQVWTNIIDNAIAAMDGRGDLLVRTYRKQDWVIVEFWDTGPGIPPVIINKVFDPFFTTKAPGKGTGLGLSISHNIIVQKHKGQMEVRSQAGSTRFIIRLPIRR